MIYKCNNNIQISKVPNVNTISNVSFALFPFVYIDKWKIITTSPILILEITLGNLCKILT